MKILINTATTFQGGAVQIALSFLRECRIFKKHDFYVFLSKSVERQLEKTDFPQNFYFYSFSSRPGSGILNYIRNLRRFKQLEREIKPDCVFTTSGPVTNIYEEPRTIKIKSVSAGEYTAPPAQGPMIAEIWGITPEAKVLRRKMSA